MVPHNIHLFRLFLQGQCTLINVSVKVPVLASWLVFNCSPWDIFRLRTHGLERTRWPGRGSEDLGFLIPVLSEKRGRGEQMLGCCCPEGLYLWQPGQAAYWTTIALDSARLTKQDGFFLPKPAWRSPTWLWWMNPGVGLFYWLRHSLDRTRKSVMIQESSCTWVVDVWFWQLRRNLKDILELWSHLISLSSSASPSWCT